MIKVDIHSKGINQNHVYPDIKHQEDPATEGHMKLTQEMIRQTQVKGHSTIKHCSVLKDLKIMKDKKKLKNIFNFKETNGT